MASRLHECYWQGNESVFVFSWDFPTIRKILKKSCLILSLPPSYCLISSPCHSVIMLPCHTYITDQHLSQCTSFLSCRLSIQALWGSIKFSSKTLLLWKLCTTPYLSTSRLWEESNVGMAAVFAVWLHRGLFWAGLRLLWQRLLMKTQHYWKCVTIPAGTLAADTGDVLSVYKWARHQLTVS